MLDAVKISVLGDKNHARLRAFPPQAVVLFSLVFSSLSRPFTGVLFYRRPRRPVNGPDNSITSSPSEPGVNAGPITTSGGKGRKRPSRVPPVDLCVTAWVETHGYHQSSLRDQNSFLSALFADISNAYRCRHILESAPCPRLPWAWHLILSTQTTSRPTSTIYRSWWRQRAFHRSQPKR